jgi:hypothetical protein
MVVAPTPTLVSMPEVLTTVATPVVWEVQTTRGVMSKLVPSV